VSKNKPFLGPGLILPAAYLIAALTGIVLSDLVGACVGLFSNPVILIAKDGIFTVLVAAVFRAYVIREQSHRDAREIYLLSLAINDPLTGLVNRQGVITHIERTIAQARLSDSRFGVAYIDLNNFKGANDYFRPCVRRCRVAGRLSAADVAGRMGGDEFAVIAVSDPADSVDKLRDRIIAMFQEPLDVEGFANSITLSIGVAHFPEAGCDAEALFHAADMDMYRVKRGLAGEVPGLGPH
jgi:diguanylate cyclase (GGDEF)-like protein